MPESGGANIEIAHKLAEPKNPLASGESRWHEVLEIVEAIVLAVVAVATAWSGYQAARWSGAQSELYGKSAKLRFLAQGTLLKGGQQQVRDSQLAVGWLDASFRGEKDLANFLERRVRPEAHPAFEAWKSTDPVHNPQAPEGPSTMPQYQNAALDEAAKLDQEASDLFEQGTKGRQRSDDYVRMTVVLATVLLLMSINRRFRIVAIRFGLTMVAIGLLGYALWHILALPRV